MKALSPLVLALLLGAAPLFAEVTITSPVNNTTVGTPFVLNASASPCSGQAISAIGYSLDAGSTTTVKASTINTQVSASTGNHVVHVKSWGNKGAACSASVTISVSTSAAPTLFTDLAVSQPTGALKLVSPFPVSATGTQCKSQPITAMGYSIDYGASTITQGAELALNAVSPTGSHTLHVKAWGNAGSACMTDVAVNVVPAPETVLPSSTIAVNGIHTLTNWQADIDTATGATDSTYGVSSLSTTPTLTGVTRQFVTTTTNYGGERYHVSFGSDTSAHSFLYDGWVYIPSSSTSISNLEFDMNQVIENGQTVIFGFQCDYWSKTWDYTANLGTPTQPNDTWVHSQATCNVQTWAPDTWHHVQIQYSRDVDGNATYQSVWLDNVEQDLNITVPSAFALNWSPTLLTNFQVDGLGSSTTTNTVYLDNLTVYRW